MHINIINRKKIKVIIDLGLSEYTCKLMALVAHAQILTPQYILLLD